MHADDQKLAIGPDTSLEEVLSAVRRWVDENVPKSWLEAGRSGGPAAVRKVRTRAEYEAWYPVFGHSGLAVATWPREYGGLDLPTRVAREADQILRPFNLGRLNPLGLNLAAPALFAHGTDEQRLRFLPPMVANEEKWCQLFSEPGAGSDLASLATVATRDGDDWIVNGQKVWTTWAHLSDYAVLIARTDVDVPKRKGITYFLIDLHQPGIDIRPLRHMGGESEFNEVFITDAVVSDFCRVGEVGDGWKVANATLSGERQMVSGSGSGGVDRIGGGGISYLIDLAKTPRVPGGAPPISEPSTRDSLMRLYSEEKVREWTNQRVRDRARAGRSPGPESSIGKVHQGGLNQRMQEMAVDLLGLSATAWTGDPSGGVDKWTESLPYEVKGMLRSRANTIEGGTTEVNKNVVGERVLGLPREPDPYSDKPWREVPRS